MRRILPLPTTRLPGVAALRRFGARLAGAYASPSRFVRVAALASPVARVLRRAAAVVHLHQAAPHWQLAMALVRAVPGAARSAPAPRPAVLSLVQRLVQRLQGREVHHLRSEHGRLRVQSVVSTPTERVVRSRAMRVRREPTQRLAAPLAMTVVRHAAAAAPVRPQPADAGPRRASGEPAWAVPPHSLAAAATPLPPQELSRVTEHVIRQLDRRVLSWQERTGRNLP